MQMKSYGTQCHVISVKRSTRATDAWKMRTKPLKDQKSRVKYLLH